MANDENLTAAEAFRKLLAVHANAFMVSGGNIGDQILYAVQNWAPFLRRMTKEEVTNLAAWLIIVADIHPTELLVVLRANGVEGGMRGTAEA